MTSCGGDKAKPTKVDESFLTLADVTGTASLKEDTPGVRVINVKTKSFIKQNDIRAAKNKALELAKVRAVDDMVQELLPSETYNREYAKINEYMSKNIGNYIVATDINGEKKIFNDKYYGISVSVKVNRQKVLVAIQKDLKLINKAGSSLVTVITSKKGIDLSSVGFRFSDIESALMNQLQTDLNQRGLTAMDFRNAVASMQTDEKKKKAFSQISKEQFMAMISGSKAGDAALNKQVQESEEFYSTGLTLLKELAKVVVEVNIFAVQGNIRGNVSLSLNVTAKNISTGTGGAFANTIVNVARAGGPNVIASAMITGLVKDSYEDMQKKFIPQVIKEMSTISVGGKNLTAYELVMKGFEKREGRTLRKLVQSLEAENLRYIDSDNTVPGIISIYVRFAGKPTELSDTIMDGLDKQQITVDEPIVSPKLRDLVFVKQEKPQS